ncbi:MAG TPA: L,D-transpeptidase family protein [Hyphomicrobiaceae bacterium]|nr:L,D-transpeptidase family protein [Hyphomicrobiaceae bacterium]
MQQKRDRPHSVQHIGIALGRITALSCILAAAMPVFLQLPGGIAHAAEGSDNAWMQSILNPGSSTAKPANYNRTFVREWESNPPRGYPTLSRENIDATKTAVKRYREIVKKGGWEKMPEFDKLEVGTTKRAVQAVHDRLLVTGHLRSASSYPDYFDYDLDKAVRRFQASNGLTPTGIVDRRTRLALDVPAKVRLRQLEVNLGRLRSHGQSGKARYVVVNIPAAQIEAVDDDRVHSRHTGVVGKIDRRTPLLTSRIHELNFNPIWRLPPTVIKKDLIPKGRDMASQKVSVLEKFGIDAYDGNGRKLDPKKINWKSGTPYNLSYRQKPGPDNPLGFVKINFHNAYSVYLHDTPSERIFGRNFRAASSGCVRVSNIEKLVTWLLDGQKGWNRRAVEDIKKSGDSKNVSLKRSVPLHLVYVTAWATPDGVVQFRRDLYQRDGVGAVAAAY